MPVRKGCVYLFVMIFVGAWFFLIIWLSYKDDRLFTPMSYATFKKANPTDFELYCMLNPRPGLPAPAPNSTVALVALLKNRDGLQAQSLLTPLQEFSVLRVQVFPAGKTEPTHDALLGDPTEGETDAENEKSKSPTWKSIKIGPQQTLGKEIILPIRVFPEAGDYRIVLHWNSDLRERLEGHVAPIDRESLLLNLRTEQIVHIAKPAPAKPDAKK